jgi:hypothetical protein
MGGRRGIGRGGRGERGGRVERRGRYGMDGRKGDRREVMGEGKERKGKAGLACGKQGAVRWSGVSVWQGVAMDSPNYRFCLTCPTSLCPASGHPLKWPYNRFRGGYPQGEWPAVVFFSLGYPNAVRPWS